MASEDGGSACVSIGATRAAETLEVSLGVAGRTEDSRSQRRTTALVWLVTAIAWQS